MNYYGNQLSGNMATHLLMDLEKKHLEHIVKYPIRRKIEFTILDRAHLLDWVNEFIHKNE